MSKGIPMLWLALLIAGCATTPSDQQSTTAMPVGQPQTVVSQDTQSMAPQSAVAMPVIQPQTPAQSAQATATQVVMTPPVGQPQKVASPSAQSAVQQSAATTLEGQSQTKVLADNKPKDQKPICSTDTLIGSHIQHHSCLTPQQMAARKAASKTAMDNTLGVTGAAVPNGIFKRNNQPPY